VMILDPTPYSRLPGHFKHESAEFPTRMGSALPDGDP
jgi:hypothetical protein